MKLHSSAGIPPDVELTMAAYIRLSPTRKQDIHSHMHVDSALQQLTASALVDHHSKRNARAYVASSVQHGRSMFKHNDADRHGSCASRCAGAHQVGAGGLCCIMPKLTAHSHARHAWMQWYSGHDTGLPHCPRCSSSGPVGVAQVTLVSAVRHG